METTIFFRVQLRAVSVLIVALLRAVIIPITYGVSCCKRE